MGSRGLGCVCGVWMESERFWLWFGLMELDVLQIQAKG